ncbi:hypothetical protein GJ496_002645 [Pomphorhynchus laevis]|nr:hypothetical protein GJ496_002645 [Pomphorhynchus laevis]
MTCFEHIPSVQVEILRTDKRQFTVQLKSQFQLTDSIPSLHVVLLAVTVGIAILHNSSLLKLRRLITTTNMSVRRSVMQKASVQANNVQVGHEDQNVDILTSNYHDELRANNNSNEEADPQSDSKEAFPGSPIFVCKYCGFWYFQRSQLIIHERAHTGEKVFKCKLCPKIFINSSKLHRHMTSHENGRLKITPRK